MPRRTPPRPPLHPATTARAVIAAELELFRLRAETRAAVLRWRAAVDAHRATLAAALAGEDGDARTYARRSAPVWLAADAVDTAAAHWLQPIALEGDELLDEPRPAHPAA